MAGDLTVVPQFLERGGINGAIVAEALKLPERGIQIAKCVRRSGVGEAGARLDPGFWLSRDKPHQSDESQPEAVAHNRHDQQHDENDQ